MAIRIDASNRSAGRNIEKGLAAAFSATAIGSLLRYTTVIPNVDASLAGGLVGILAYYSGTKLLPILRSGCENAKSDFFSLINRKVTLGSLVIPSAIGVMTGLATWAINPTAAIITGIGSVLATVYDSSLDAVPPAAPNGLPRNFMAKQRASFDVDVDGQYQLADCHSAAAAFEAVKGRLAPQQYDSVMTAILAQMFASDQTAFMQLLYTKVDEHYTYPGVDLPGILRDLQTYFIQLVQANQQGAPQVHRRGQPQQWRRSGRSRAFQQGHRGWQRGGRRHFGWR